MVFVDEFGYAFNEELATTWAPRGQTPLLKRVSKFRREVSTLVGLSITGKIYKRHFKGSIKSPQVIQALDYIRRQINRPIIIVWDRAQIHRSKLVASYLARHPQILVEELPTFAPELNPEEYCHGTVKGRLRNLNPDNADQIRRQLNTEFAKLRNQPDTLLGFFHHAGLSLRQLW